jgi:poly-gamma-glutamate capsule biosynthesis protein CapA/YwtB (metallophosphatase superfamily)
MKLRWALLLVLFLLMVVKSDGQSKSGSLCPQRLKLLFAGDIMGHGPQIHAAFDSISGKYNYQPCFTFVDSLVHSADIAFANLEVTLAGPEYTGYPQFSSPDELAQAIKATGFNCLVTANNHSADRGKKGIIRTINVLDDLKIKHTGTFLNQNQRDTVYPLVLEKNNIRLSILNYTYGTNGNAVPGPCIVNVIDTILIKRDLEKAGKQRPDFIIAFVHWGNEYQREENDEQRAFATFMLRNGIDAIIGSHPHVVQPVKIIYVGKDSLNKHLVAFSLGNFISNQRNRFTDGGIMTELYLEKDTATRVKEVKVIPVWVYKNVGVIPSGYSVIPITKTCNSVEGRIQGIDNINAYRLFMKDIKDQIGGLISF